MSFLNSTSRPSNISLMWSGKHVVQYLETENTTGGITGTTISGQEKLIISEYFLGFRYAFPLNVAGERKF